MIWKSEDQRLSFRRGVFTILCDYIGRESVTPVLLDEMCAVGESDMAIPADIKPTVTEKWWERN